MAELNELREAAGKIVDQRLTNSAFMFHQYTNVDSQGWPMQQQGYLSEEQPTRFRYSWRSRR